MKKSAVLILYKRFKDVWESKSCINGIFIKTKMNQTKIIPLILETTITDHFSIYRATNTNIGENKKRIIAKTINCEVLKSILSN